MLLQSLSASKCKNIQNIPCPTFADIATAIRALSHLNIKANSLDDGSKRALGKALVWSKVQFLACDEWSITEETHTFDVARTRSSSDLAMLTAIAQNNPTLVLTGLKGHLCAGSCKSGSLMCGCGIMWYMALSLKMGFFISCILVVLACTLSFVFFLPPFIESVRICYYASQASMACNTMPSTKYRRIKSSIESDAELDDLEISVEIAAADGMELRNRGVPTRVQRI